MRRLLPFAILALTVGPLSAQSERAGLFRVQVSVTPRQVPADGKSQARLRIEVKDHRGAAAPDGTQVVIHTDVGLLGLGSAGRQPSLTVRTAGGFAIVYATSTLSGTATVTVQAADSRSLAYVDFLPEGEAAAPDARVLDVSGAWVGYSVELATIEARDQVRVKFGKLIFECGSVMQLSIENLTLKATDVVVRRGDMKLEGEDLYFDLVAKRGVIRRFGEEHLERVFFDAVGLRPLETEWDIPADAFRMDNREGQAWMVARSISFFLHEKVVLRNSALWVQDQKVFSFPPYWIIGLPGYAGATNSQALGMTSDGGLAIDFPFFYRVTDRATGAIRVQHGALSSGVTSRRGWSFAISEEYRDGNGVEGQLLVSGLPRQDWGFEWRDSRPVLGDGYGYFSFAMPDHQSVFSDATVYDYAAGGRVNLRAYYDRPQDYPEAYGIVGDWLLDPRPIGDGAASYRLGTSLGWRRYAGEGQSVFVNELFSELDLGDRKLGQRTVVSPSFTNVFSWDTGGYLENSLRGELRLEHSFGRSCSLGLDYGAEWREGKNLLGPAGLQQVIGLDLHANSRSKWVTYLSATYDLTNQDTYGYLNFDYYLSEKWRAGLLATYYDLDTTQYDDIELSVGRQLGNREISLNYSTDTGRFSVSLGGFGLR